MLFTHHYHHLLNLLLLLIFITEVKSHLPSYQTIIESKNLHLLRKKVESGEEHPQPMGLLVSLLYMKKWSQPAPLSIIDEYREERLLLDCLIASYPENLPLPSIIYYILAVEEERSNENFLSESTKTTAIRKCIALYKKAIVLSPSTERHAGSLYRLARLALKGHHTFPRHLAKLLGLKMTINQSSPMQVARFYLSLNESLEAKYCPDTLSLEKLESIFVNGDHFVADFADGDDDFVDDVSRSTSKTYPYDVFSSARKTYPLRLLSLCNSDSDFDNSSIIEKLESMLNILQNRFDSTSKKVFSLITEFIKERFYLSIWKQSHRKYQDLLCIRLSKESKLFSFTSEPTAEGRNERIQEAEFFLEMANFRNSIEDITEHLEMENGVKKINNRKHSDHQSDSLPWFKVMYDTLIVYIAANITEVVLYQNLIIGVSMLICIILFIYFVSLLFRGRSKRRRRAETEKGAKTSSSASKRKQKAVLRNSRFQVEELFSSDSENDTVNGVAGINDYNDAAHHRSVCTGMMTAATDTAAAAANTITPTPTSPRIKKKTIRESLKK